MYGDVDRREAARPASEAKPRQRVDGIELIALAFDERAAEGAVDEIFLRHLDGQKFISLRRRVFVARESLRRRCAGVRRTARGLIAGGRVVCGFARFVICSLGYSDI